MLKKKKEDTWNRFSVSFLKNMTPLKLSEKEDCGFSSLEILERFEDLFLS